MAELFRIVPAYGRKYEGVVEALHDWEAGKDFSAFPGPGPYLSKTDGVAMKWLSEQGYDGVVLQINNQIMTYYIHTQDTTLSFAR